MSAHVTDIKPESRQVVQHRVKLVKNHNYVRNGRKSYAHILRKYNIKPTVEGPFTMVDEVHRPDEQHVLHRLQNRIQGKSSMTTHRRLLIKDENGHLGEVPAQDVQNDAEYIADVAIGTPPQVMKLDFDTGSADLFGRQRFREVSRRKGRRHITICLTNRRAHHGKPLRVSIGASLMVSDSSSAGGNVGTDNVEIGGITVKNQAVEIANRMSQQFRSFAGDGLLGLAFGSINQVKPTPVKTPVENMIAQSSISESCEVFTAYLGSFKDQNDPDHGQSFYTFGFIDQNVVKSTGSEIHYTPIDKSNGFWQVSSQGYAINSETFHTSNNSAIIDTGTTLAMVDDQMCKNIYANIPGAKLDKTQGGYVLPSNTPLGTLPTVEFDVGGQFFKINKEDIPFAPIGNGMSFGGIQSRGDLPFDIYGDTFLKNVYAIFDVGRNRFGCVQRVDPDGNTSSPQKNAAVAAKA